MKPNYCLPIIKSSTQEVLDVIKAHENNYGYFEVWIDYLEDCSNEFVQDLSNQLKSRLIVLFRRQNLETIYMPIGQRFSLIELLARTDSYIDLDVGTQQAELGHLKDLEDKPKLISSYHNYQATPSAEQLTEIIVTMEAYIPKIYKLSTACQEPADALRLLDILVQLKASGKRVVVSGMGEAGKVVRVFGPLWGSELAFVPASETGASAPGQLTREQLETIYKQLGINHAG